MKTIEELNEELRVASRNNNLETVKYLVESGADKLDDALVNASYYNNLEMVKYLVEKGATDLNLALYYASNYNNLEIANYLKSIIKSKENNKNASSNWFKNI